MKVSETRMRLGQTVTFNKPETYLTDTIYRLTAVIMRIDDHGQYRYQAEIEDVKSNPKSVLIVDLDDIK